MGVAFLLAPLLIHAFGPSGFGAFTLVASIASFVLLFDLGLGQTIEKQLAEYTAVGKLAEAGALLASVRRTYVGIGLAVAAVELLLAALAPHVFRLSGSEVEWVRQLLWVAAAGAVVWWPLSVGVRVLAGLQRYTLIGPVTAGMAVANALAAGIVVWLHAGPVVLAVLAQLIAIAGALVMQVQAKRELASHGVGPAAPDRTVLASAFAFAGPVFLLQLAVTMFYHQTDRLLLGMFVGSVAVTLYEGPARLVALLIQLTGFGNNALMPFASQLEAASRSETLEALLLRASRYVSAFVAPLALLLALLARPLLVHWLGPAFVAAEMPTILLTGVQVILVSLTVGHTIVVATGKLGGRMPVILTIVALNLVLSVLFVRWWGVTGVALGTVVASLIDFPLHLRYLQRHVGLHLGAFARQVVLPVYPLLLVPAAGAIAARSWGVTDTLLGTLVTLALCAIAYWMTFMAVSVPRRERDELLAIARGLLAPKRAVTP
jgi:O-antigen/teichoic acid export membrane protein